MKVNGIPTRTIRSIDGGRAVEIIDQTLLPYRFERRTLTDWRDCVEAIAEMRVRGAPLIGITGAWAVALAVREDSSNAALLKAAEVIAHIGEVGVGVIAELYTRLRRPVNILTHCNAGWLATVDYGTALAPIYAAFERGIPVHVWVDETRPRNQGLLTAWELGQHGVPHTIIADNAGGELMQQGEVDIVIVGADRITRRGDVANKIGTYLKALAAKDNDIPFYAAAPYSTIDWKMVDGKREIPIENRASSELLTVRGIDSSGKVSVVQIAPLEEAAANPAFDVTHNRFVTGIITERGVFTPTALAAAYQDLSA